MDIEAKEIPNGQVFRASGHNGTINNNHIKPGYYMRRDGYIFPIADPDGMIFEELIKRAKGLNSSCIFWEIKNNLTINDYEPVPGELNFQLSLAAVKPEPVTQPRPTKQKVSSDW